MEGSLNKHWDFISSKCKFLKSAFICLAQEWKCSWNKLWCLQTIVIPREPLQLTHRKAEPSSRGTDKRLPHQHGPRSTESLLLLLSSLKGVPVRRLLTVLTHKILELHYLVADISTTWKIQYITIFFLTWCILDNLNRNGIHIYLLMESLLLELIHPFFLPNQGLV